MKQREKEGVLNMQKSLFPGYTIGPDAYEDIVNVCPAYGKKAVSYTHLTLPTN